MINDNNQQEYNDPIRYDAEYGNFAPDGPFFLDIAKQIKGPVLDIGCGTGRLTIPIAKNNIEVTGIDISEHMIKEAMNKSVGLNIKWLQADALNFELNKTFALAIIGGNGFQAFLTTNEQKQVLKRIKHHLRPGGVLAFGIRNPLIENLQQDSGKDLEFWHSFIDKEGNDVIVSGKHLYDEKNEIATYTTIRKWPNHTTTATIKLKYTNYHQLLTLLVECGYEVVKIYGNYNKNSWSSNSPNIVLISEIKDK